VNNLSGGGLCGFWGALNFLTEGFGEGFWKLPRDEDKMQEEEGGRGIYKISVYQKTIGLYYSGNWTVSWICEIKSLNIPLSVFFNNPFNENEADTRAQIDSHSVSQHLGCSARLIKLFHKTFWSSMLDMLELTSVILFIFPYYERICGNKVYCLIKLMMKIS